jgi:hypothetical protein
MLAVQRDVWHGWSDMQRVAQHNAQQKLSLYARSQLHGGRMLP